jgi:hypothetical protein
MRADRAGGSALGHREVSFACVPVLRQQRRIPSVGRRKRGGHRVRAPAAGMRDATAGGRKGTVEGSYTPTAGGGGELRTAGARTCPAGAATSRGACFADCETCRRRPRRGCCGRRASRGS